jgi:hypothetical protein
VLRFLRRHGIPLLAVALGTFAFAAMLTEGKFDLTTRGEHYAEFYDQLGRSMLHGRFDVPKDVIGLEAFVIDGKYYGYWGPTPALLRLPLNVLFPSMMGRWIRLVMVAGAASTLLAVYALFLEAGRAMGGWTGRDGREQWTAAAFILMTALGSTLLFIGRRPSIYHEAIVLGAALALWSYAWLARYLRGGATRHLVLAAVTAALAALARSSVGAGPLFSLTVLAGAMVLAITLPGRPPLERALRYLGLPRGARLVRQAAILVAILALTAAAIGFRNYRTVGKVTGEPSFAQHIVIRDDPARLARVQGRVIHPENFRTMFYNYFRPDGIVIKRGFPWFAPRGKDSVHVFPEAHYDNGELYASVPAAYPFWLALALLGLVLAARPGASSAAGGGDPRAPLRLAIAGSALGSLGPFIHVYLTMRYLHDLFPFLLITAAIGLQWLLARCATDRWARAVMPFLVLLGLYSCLATVGISMAHVVWT